MSVIDKEFGGKTMKISEIAQSYQVPLSTLRYYEKMGLFENVKRINGIREYDDKDIERLSLILSLKHTGLEIKEILQYLKINNIDKRIDLLLKRRKKSLDLMHLHQKNINTIDNLIYQINREREKR